jgi:hypothetical protein
MKIIITSLGLLINLGSTINITNTSLKLCYRQLHIQKVLSENFVYIRKNNKGKDKYFNCKITNYSNSTNRIEFTYNISVKTCALVLLKTVLLLCVTKTNLITLALVYHFKCTTMLITKIKKLHHEGPLFLLYIVEIGSTQIQRSS